MNLERLTKKISKKMFDMGMLTEKESIYCDYFLQTRIEQILSFLAILILSLIFGKFFQTIIFLIFFRALRVNSGGFHADTFLKCFLGSMGVYVLFAAFLCRLMLSYAFVSGVIFIAMSIVVLAFGAVNNEYIDWDEDEHRASKKRVRIAAALEITAVIVTYIHLGESDYVAFMSFAVALCGLLLLLGRATQRKESE